MNSEINTKKINNMLKSTKLNKAFDNYKIIINKNLPYKFSYLDEWIYKNSNLLLNEAENIVQKYKTYKRGTIIKVDFGVNIGSEMSQVHFAIVLSKSDNPRNNVLTVLPLTSKKGRFNICLDTLIANKLLEKLKFEKKKLEKIISDTNSKDSNIEKAKNKQYIINSQINKLKFLAKYYKKSLKTTYGCANLITTISKTRLLNPINEYDIIGKTICPDEVLNTIDNEIIQKFTNFQKN